jgi:(2R)-sulfolactate sulfo-lyase subunit alpha
VHGFLIHNEGDDVGVATDDIEGGAEVLGVYMDSGATVTVTAHGDIPLGHKIALSDLAEGADVIEYGVRIGRTRHPVRAGDYVHTHNIRSARWTTS